MTPLVSNVFGILLIVLSAILLLYASRRAPGALRRPAAALSLLTLAGGFAVMYATYDAARDQWLLAQFEPPAKQAGRERAAADRNGTQAGQAGTAGRGRNSAAAGDANGGAGSPSDTAGALTRMASLAGSLRTVTDITGPLRDCPDCPDLVLIEPGFLRMGPVKGDDLALPSEGPVFTASVPKRYLIGRTEITVGQFAIFIHETGHARPACGFTDPVRDANLPVDCISWRAAVTYTQWLSTRTGRTYRLPTETEWTYAARGTSTKRYALGDEIPSGDAHIDQRRPKRIAVGTYPGNAFGLKDVHGSVAELVADCWNDTLRNTPADARRWARRGDCSRRVLKDAHAGEAPALARLSARRQIGVDEARMGVGLRILREL